MFKLDGCLLLRGSMFHKLILIADPESVLELDSGSMLSCSSFFGYEKDEINLKKKHPRSAEHDVQGMLATYLGTR
jgi:hypothetical protein